MAPLTTLGSPTIITKTVFGNKRVVICTLTFGNATLTWPSGGLSFTPSQVGMARFQYVSIDSDGQQVYRYDYTNQMIDAYLPAGTGGATNIMVAANGSAPASGTIRILAIGYGAF